MHLLPLKIEDKDKELLVKMGIVFLNKQVNSVQQEILLPEGWTRRIENHYWTHFLDEKGRVRVMVFCKQEMWDTSSHCSIIKAIKLTSRVATSTPEEKSKTDEWGYICEVQKHYKTIYTTDVLVDFSGAKATEAAENWLKENYPDWKNPLAYWD